MKWHGSSELIALLSKMHRRNLLVVTCRILPTLAILEGSLSPSVLLRCCGTELGRITKMKPCAVSPRLKDPDNISILLAVS